MTRKTVICLATAVTAASIQLTGCGRTPSQPHTPPMAQPAIPPSATQQADQTLDDLRQWHQNMMAQLALTDEQKTQLRAIKERYRDPSFKQALKDKIQQLGTQISGETVDQEALEQTFNELLAAFRGKAPQMATKAGEIRDVLTAEQRQRIGTILSDNADAIKNMMDRLRDRGFTELSANLNLNAEQSAALQRLKELDEQADEARFDTMRAAITTFMANGNQESLRASLESVLTSEHIDDTVDWIASLDRTQRQQLVTNLMAYMAKMKAMHRAMEADMGMADTTDASS